MNDANTTAAVSPGTPSREAKTLRGLSPQQWKSGIAAWLGWLFDGLDMHLYGLVALPFVTALILQHNPSLTSDAATALAKNKSGIIQAAFLVGWALGGGFFGRLGDKLGRSRALSLTILTYATFTGLSCFAQTWWQLLIFRFLAALGIGGEWAVGSSLLSETWPKRWRPWIAAVLQTGVNLGVLLACLTTYLMAGSHPKYVFLVGILPALLVFWIRRHVPEPDEWHTAKRAAHGEEPRIFDLFAPGIRRTTFLTIIVCACGLTAWWSFMFWHIQHLFNLPELKGWAEADRKQLVSVAFFLVISSSIVGNFFVGWLARRVGYKRCIAMMYLGFFVAMFVTFMQERDYKSLVYFWFPVVGFFSGIFGLFTMYLPPLFPTLLRSTGAGFCYNIGRIASAAGVITFGFFAKVNDFRTALLCASFLFLPAMLVALILPEPSDEHEATAPVE